MGIAEIRKRNGEVITLNTAEPFCALKEATLTSSLMGDDYITLKIVSSQWLSFAKGDKITYEGKEYTVRTTPTREVVADGYYNYEVVFYGVMYDLMKTLYRNCDDEGKSDRSTFDLTYTIKEFVQVVINNLNRDYPGIWAFDELNCPQTEAKTLQFAGVNCLQALQTLCTKDNFNLEFQITQDNGVRTIHIGKFGKVVTPPHGAAYFEWGKGNGLFNLKEQKVDDKAVITRLWVEGGTTNIRTDYRNYSERLQLPYPKRNNAYEHTLEDGRVVLPNTEAIGIDDDTKRYLEDAALRDQIGSEEDVKLYEDIYPTRTGTVTALVDDDICAFIDDTMDFDLNAKAGDGKSDAYLVNGTSAKVTFTSGRLAGQEFELEAKGGYNHALKKFRIIAFTDNRGLTIPSAETHDAYHFEVGDTYKITDIYLPESYEKRAEENLWYAGLDDFNQAKQVKAQYSLTFDRLYFVEAMPQDADTSVFEVGDFVPIKDTRFGIEKSIRIQKIQRNLLVAHDYQLTLADSVAISIQSQTVLDVIDHEQIIENNRLRDLNKARRGWRTTEELRTMVYDPDGYFDPENIRPNSIDTNMLTVGSKSQQFVLTGVVLQANGGGNPQVFVAKAGVLSHLTIDPTGIRQWHMEGARFTFNNANAYYLFARCPKVGSNGTWFPSQTPMKCEPTSDPNAYYFQVGVIGSLQAGDTFRDFVTTYGFTRINGNTITTGRIVTSDGECYLDLDGNKFRIGDSASSVDWNVTRRNGITLKNVSVASGSGDVSPLGVYRGVWNAAYTYFQNDEVSYTANGATATYRYVNPQPTAGNLPTDSVFWAIVAKGADGVNGDWVTTVFKQSDTKPDAPIGTAPIPNGWADAPSGDGKWWMSKGIVNGVSGEVASWSDPVQVTAEDGNDGAYTDFKYAKNNSDVAAPSIVKTDRDPAGWSDEPPALSQDEYLWMTQAEINANGTLNGQWSDPVRISGEKGADGADGISPNASFKSTVFLRTNAAPPTPSGGTYSLPIPVGGGWSDGIPAGEAKLWASTRIFTTDGLPPQQTQWTAPRQMTDTADFDVEYSSDENPTNPTGHPNTNTQWSNTADDSTIWMATSRKSNGVWGDWQVSRIKGENGQDGTSINVKGTFSQHAATKADVDIPTARTYAIIDTNEDAEEGNQEVWYAYWSGLVGATIGGTTRPNKYYTYHKAQVGDAFVSSANGHLYMADTDHWQDIGQFKGDKGNTGANGQNAYLHVKYANSLTEGDWTANNGETPGKYIGVYTDNSPSDRLEWALYSWTKWQGEDGYGYEYIYKRTTSNNAPCLVFVTTQDTDTNADDYVPLGWTDNPTGVSAEYPYEWIAFRKKTDGTWSGFKGSASNPTYAALWAKFGQNGKDGADGQDGQDGVNGDFTEYRYAVNGSKSSSPTLASSNRDPGPAVWNTAMPTNIAPLRYVWMTQAKINGTTNALIGEWSTPIRVTPYDGKDGQNGANGKNGNSPALVFRGVYSQTANYYGNARRVDAVKYNNRYYVAAIRDTTNPFTNISPDNGTYWNDFGAEFETIATGFLLAENANIAGWIFRNGRMESQATDGSGNPMAYLDGVNGTARLKGTLQLSCASAGNVSDSNLFYLPPITAGNVRHLTMGYEKEDIGKVVRLFNASSFGGGIYYVSGNTFDISGNITQSTSTYESAVEPQEIIEMTCFERQGSTSTNIKGQWVLTARFGVRNFQSANIKGRFPLMLAMGRISGGANYVYANGNMWDGRDLSTLFTCTRLTGGKNNAGRYKIAFANGLFPSGYKVFCTGYGSWINDARVYETANDHFSLGFSDDASENDGSCDFMIMGLGWDYPAH